ncbi:MAG: YfcE family phosphodiesterase [Thermoguttaceae bacterium]|nr:YfcE family phosphodiesterase [Thermoguttaceae bacterium]
MIRIGVLSDTHGDLNATLEALEIFDCYQAKTLIHCGDIGEDVYPALPAGRTYCVSGNTDDSWVAQRFAMACGLNYQNRFGRLTLGNIRIAFLHGDDRSSLRFALYSGNFDLVLQGHTHVAENSLIDHQVRLVNPGAVVRSARPSVAVITLPEISDSLTPSELAAARETAMQQLEVQPGFLRSNVETAEEVRQAREQAARRLIPPHLLQSGILR